MINKSNIFILFYAFIFYIVAVLHLAFINEDGSLHYLDMDLSIPTFKAANGADFDGHSGEYHKYLERERPVGWREELSKLEMMTSAQFFPGVTRSVRIRCISPGVIIPSQVNIKIGLHGKLLAIILLNESTTSPYFSICMKI